MTPPHTNTLKGFNFYKMYKVECLFVLILLKVVCSNHSKIQDRLHDQFVLIPADNTGNTIVFEHYINSINCTSEEVGFYSASSNTTYTISSLSLCNENILENHML